MSPPPSTRRRADERARRRRRILAAATRLFARRGLENVTFGDIAQRAGLSRPLVYFYFPDQRTLFLEAVLMVRAQLQNRIERVIDEVRHTGGHGLDQLEALCRAYAGFQEQEADAFQLSSLCDAQGTHGAGTDALGQLISGSERALHACCAGIVKRGQEDGSIRLGIGDAEEVAAVLLGWMQGLIQLRATRPLSLKVNARLEPAAYLESGLRLLRGALAQQETAGTSRRGESLCAGQGRIPAFDSSPVQDL